MSLIRPRWLEDFVKPNVSASPRLRGLKGFEPHHAPAFQDPLYADDPIFWIVSSSLPAVALNTGHVGIQTPSDDSLLCIVDLASVASDVAADVRVQVTVGGVLLLNLGTDSSVAKRNRREQARNTQLERAGLLRISDNSNAFTGSDVAAAHIQANQTAYIPLGYRLFGGEQLFLTTVQVQQQLQATLWGRLTTKGQR